MAFDIQSWFISGEAQGVFTFFLPGLLIFAVIFGILSAVNAFGGNKAVNLIISLVVAAMSLRLPFVQDFFLEVFPRTAVAIAVLLVLLILTAVFIPQEHLSAWSIVFYSVAALAFIFVILNSFKALNYFGSYWWDDWGQNFIFGILFIGAILAVVFSTSKSKGGTSKATFGPWWPNPNP